FGREVHPLLRALSLPGAGPALGLLTMRPTLGLLAWLARHARKAGARTPARAARRLRLMLASLGDRGQQAAAIRTLRSVIGCRRQSVFADARSSALRRFPTLLMWGTHDRVIPVDHASTALTSLPGTELVLLDGIGHLPHLTRGEFVAERLSFFIDES